MNQFHQGPEYLIKTIQICRKITEILAAQGAQPVSVANEKIFNQKSLNYLVWTTIGSRVNILIFFSLSSLSGVSSLILFPLFDTCVIDTGGKFATGINNTTGTVGKICRRYR
jgi:hypothetical protein